MPDRTQNLTPRKEVIINSLSAAQYLPYNNRHSARFLNKWTLASCKAPLDLVHLKTRLEAKSLK
jgi:hypothetical protein